VQTFTAGAQCTANFVFSDSANVYIGQAAHCSGTGGNTATNGCTSPSLPLGTHVDVGGATNPGTLVYNSWLTMHALSESDANTCDFNDLALVKIDPADVPSVNPSIPFWGGPTGIATSTKLGQTVESYGNSELRLGVSLLSPKVGKSLGDSGGGWSHQVYTVTPGIPGDSGSAYLDDQGRALGILSTVEIAPVAGSNGVGDLSRELAYMQAHSEFTRVALVPGDVAFRGTVGAVSGRSILSPRPAAAQPLGALAPATRRATPRPSRRASKPRARRHARRHGRLRRRGRGSLRTHPR
jgi:hypothetical protein